MTRGRLLSALVFVVLAVGPVALPPFYITLLNVIGLASLVALGLVLLTGVAGLTSFGQAAFVGIGAYVTGYLTTRYGVSPWLTLPVALLTVAVVAYVLGWVTLRLSGHYLPLSTIAWGTAIYYLFSRVPWLGGPTGMTGIPAVRLFGFALNTPPRFYYLIWLFVALALLASANLLDSRMGRAIRAMRGGRLMAESFGVHAPRARMAVFLVAALLAGLSGWLYAHLLQFLNPSPFDLINSIEYLFMAVVGGAGYLWGAVIGAGVLTLLQSWLQDLLPSLLGQSGNFDVIVYGVLVALLMQHTRDGIVGYAIRLLPTRLSRKRIIQPQAAPLAARHKPPSGETLLEVRSATRRFGGLVAVNELSFSVRAGEIVGLIGPNGAGKSTMFNLISGVLPLSDGEIRFEGARISGRRPREIIRLGVARTFQHVRLLREMSAIENVMLGAHLRGHRGLLRAALRLDRAEETRLAAEAARQLARVGLADFADAPAGSLALGQQRLLEIARALAADPVLLLLDEPAAGLRLLEKQKLAALLDQLRSEGMGLLLVEHDMDFVMDLVDRLIVMDFGTKIAEGLPRAVQSDERVLEAYLGGVA